jgi:hypothetical protein
MRLPLPKGPQGQKRKEPSRKLPADRVALNVQIMRDVAEQAAGDVGDKITRAPKKAKR